MRLGLLLWLLLWGEALAEEGAYVGLLGAGPTLSWAKGEPARWQGALLLKSAYGLSDRLNWEGPLLVEMGRGELALTLGSGLERVLYATNHWRWNAGGGAALRLPLRPDGNLALGPYAQSALRWTLSWGFGVALEAHAVMPWVLGDKPTASLRLTPALALFSEL